MRQIIFIVLYSIISIPVFSQPTIEILLTNHPFASRGSNIESIEERYELILSDIKPKPYKVVMMFDKTGNIISEITYGKAGGMQSETKFEYNSNQKLIKKGHRYFLNMLGWRVEETTVTYNDTTGFVSEIRYIKNGLLLSTSKVFCDDLGKPNEVRVLDNKGAFSSIERIAYSPNVNIIRVMLFTPSNQFISRWIYPLDYTKPYQSGQVERQYYPNGEVMLESLEDETKIDQGYFYEYRYDSQGNWIERDTYQVTIGRNKNIKDKKLEHKIFRTIKYY
jgi:hypothetical protein